MAVLLHCGLFADSLQVVLGLRLNVNKVKFLLAQALTHVTEPSDLLQYN